MVELATFAAGEAQGVEAHFHGLPGVLGVHVAHAGGQPPAVEIRFDPAKISYDRLLAAFFDSHDPTEVSRQDAELGSAIFTHSPQQKAAAEAAKAVLDRCGRFRRPIVTEIVTAAFGPATDDHQTHFERRED